MPLRFTSTRIAKISDSTFVHEVASVIKDVFACEQCFIRAGAALRGDYRKITTGNRSLVFKNCVLHTRSLETHTVGSDVLVRNGSFLHYCKMRDFAVVGLGSRICDYAVVGLWTIVSERAVVTSRTLIPYGKFSVGIGWERGKDDELCHRYKRVRRESSLIFGSFFERLLKPMRVSIPTNVSRLQIARLG